LVKFLTQLEGSSIHVRKEPNAPSGMRGVGDLEKAHSHGGKKTTVWADWKTNVRKKRKNSQKGGRRENVGKKTRKPRKGRGGGGKTLGESANFVKRKSVGKKNHMEVELT